MAGTPCLLGVVQLCSFLCLRHLQSTVVVPMLGQFGCAHDWRLTIPPGDCTQLCEQSWSEVLFSFANHARSQCMVRKAAGWQYFQIAASSTPVNLMLVGLRDVLVRTLGAVECFFTWRWQLCLVELFVCIVLSHFLAGPSPNHPGLPMIIVLNFTLDW